jgi:Beta-lactamase
MMTRRTFQAGGLWVAAVSQAFGADAPNAAGTWSSLLEAGSQRLRLKVEVGRDGTATLASVDEATPPEPGRLTVLASEQIALEFPTIRAMFRGHFVGPDRIEGLWRQGIRFEGQWRKGFLSLPLAFTRGEAALRVPPPVGPLTRERLAELRAEAGSPAIAAASARRGSISPRVWVAGERAIGTGIAAQESDLWHLGSIGKSMTSSLVARLADGGAVHWDETVGDILGEGRPGDARCLSRRELPTPAVPPFRFARKFWDERLAVLARDR